MAVLLDAIKVLTSLGIYCEINRRFLVAMGSRNLTIMIRSKSKITKDGRRISENFLIYRNLNSQVLARSKLFFKAK